MFKIFENFENKITKGLSIALVASLPFSFSGCTMEELTTDIVTSSDDGLSTEDNFENELIFENGENVDFGIIYKFPFIKCNKNETILNENFDWDVVENTLKNDKKEFRLLLNPKEHHNYEIALYEDSGTFGSTYYYIINRDAERINDISYEGTVIHVNQDVSILETDTKYSDTDLIDYILFDHNDGTFKIISANSLRVAKKYIVKTTISSDGKKEERLLYSNGDPVVEEAYENIICDAYTGNLFLIKDNYTEILDTLTLTAKKIPQKVVAANNGYLTIEIDGKKGVSYFGGLVLGLVEKIPCEFDSVYTVNQLENPLYSCLNYNVDNKSTVSKLYSSEGKCLSKEYKFIGYDTYTSGYIDVQNSNDTRTLIDYNGVEVLSNIESQCLIHVPLTDKVVYRENGNGGKYGIIDFNGTVLLPATYDRIFINIFKEENENTDCFIICRNEARQETVVFNKELGQELIGDFGVYEAIDKTLAKPVKVYSKEKEN